MNWQGRILEEWCCFLPLFTVEPEPASEASPTGCLLPAPNKTSPCDITQQGRQVDKACLPASSQAKVPRWYYKELEFFSECFLRIGKICIPQIHTTF